jgi:hypothetical protein
MPEFRDYEQWSLSTGRNGYTEGAKHSSGIMVYRNPSRLDMGTHIVYSGKTLQKIQMEHGLSSFEVLKYHCGRHDNVARIDVALDIKNTDLTVQHFQDAYEQNKCITKLKTASVIKNIGSDGHTFYIGSTKKRKKLVRIYDKRAETNTAISWTRIEAQIMGKPATKLSNEISCALKIDEVILGALFDIVDFPTIEIWKDIIDGKTAVELGASNDKMSDTRKWLEKTVFKSLLAEGEKDKLWFDEFVTSLLVEHRRHQKGS